MGRSLLILLDTHVVIWLAFEQDRLSKNARAIIEEARLNGEGLAISGISLFELARAFHREREHFTISVESALAEVERRFTVLPINSRISIQALYFPATYPKDPADRIIGATALVEGLTLVTADAQIRKSGALRTIW
ncbi:MAG TPA: type II toxin-antitoxin system VapC family toxin [Candidatus Sulfotelmatobacter sp.]|jgi:PIN domain nuclease of toxin-antitoxin system